MTGDGINHQVRNRHLVESLERSLRSGKHGLSVVPGLLKQLIAEESWREFTTQRGELVQHKRFADFVTTPPLKGLGASVELIERIVAEDAEAVQLLRDALRGKPGPKSHEIDDHDSRSHDVITRSPHGTSKSYALQRLSRDAPELHTEVLAGRLTAHKAMVEAGFRARKLSVRLDDPASAARALRANGSPEFVAEVARLLNEEG